MSPQLTVAAIEEYLSDCFAAGTSPRVGEFAGRLRVTPWQLTRATLQAFGVTPSRYFRRAEIGRARELLADTALSMDEVAIHSGFGTRNTFFRAFRESMGVTPAQYRRDVAQNDT